jgi:glutathione S-transferase
MYTLYIGNKNYSSWSLRPWVLMRELNIPFEEKLVPFNTGSSFDKFRSFSPTGRVPCLVDSAQTVWDSLAIAEYLAERHDGVWPHGAQARAWARCATAEMHSGFAILREYCAMNCGIRVKLHAMPPSLVADIARLNELWLDGLARFGGPFLAGSRFTAVDAFFAPVAFRHLTYAFTLDADTAAYAQRLRDLPSMRAWYEAALKERWREPDHEEGAQGYGVWTADLRAT